MLIAYIDNTNLLTVPGVAFGAVVIEDAEVTLTMLDPGGEEIAGVDWPLTFLGGTDGTYYVYIPSTAVAPTSKKPSTAVVTITASGSTATLKIPVQWAERRGDCC